ncbi:hypothetical protein [Flagellimonas nanhaiensis]|uniref:Uncharacterized protein n=1 Tax=Flagellimonas nanhaiensis TaxID=2292706 RepID=A0A371JT30_9FLAO|nr:hypothetical protein [Allomuricauda nanhaiensis]RDY60936.1 hypothetical protein DX873_01805 [Allomuricauda nanhaiensis]
MKIIFKLLLAITLLASCSTNDNGEIPFEDPGAQNHDNGDDTPNGDGTGDGSTNDGGDGSSNDNGDGSSNDSGDGSSDDNGDGTDDPAPVFIEENAIKYQDTLYELTELRTYEGEGNYISLSISNQTQEDRDNNLEINDYVFVGIDLLEEDWDSLESSTNFDEHYLMIDGSFKDGVYVDGPNIINSTETDLSATYAEIFVNSISETEINIDIVFTRVDGEEIVVHYDGPRKQVFF